MAPKKTPTSADNDHAAVPEEAGTAVDVTDLRAILLAFQTGLNELQEVKQEIRRMSDSREGTATSRSLPSPLRSDTFGSVADLNALSIATSKALNKIKPPTDKTGLPLMIWLYEACCACEDQGIPESERMCVILSYLHSNIVTPDMRKELTNTVDLVQHVQDMHCPDSEVLSAFCNDLWQRYDKPIKGIKKVSLLCGVAKMMGLSGKIFCAQLFFALCTLRKPFNSRGSSDSQSLLHWPYSLHVWNSAGSCSIRVRSLFDN
jgi:hypothetical protein